jgi:elongation factor Ts
MNVSIEDIKTLRAKTSAGMALCKEALVASEGDMKKAIEYINKKSDVVSRLRNLTGAKIGLCKMALEEAENDFEKAVEIIKERGWDEPIAGESSAEKGEGVIETYLHGMDHQLASIVEVKCKTDFVSSNDEFRAFAHEIALQVAAMKPVYVSKEDISDEEMKKIKEIFKKETEAEGKPENMIEKIVEGKLSKYFSEKCLLDQKWFKDESKTIQNLLDEAVQKLGEPIQITRILFWELGVK